jgi:hypothetical protein
VVATDDAGESSVSMSKMLVGDDSGCLPLRGVCRGAMAALCWLRQKLQVARVSLSCAQLEDCNCIGNSGAAKPMLAVHAGHL